MLKEELQAGMIFRASAELIEVTIKEIDNSNDPVLKHGLETMSNFLHHDFHVSSIDVENNTCSISSVILTHMSRSLGDDDVLQHYHLDECIRAINDGHWSRVLEDDDGNV